jgi:RNA polymerase sigma-70 factor (ECF subfamily)
MGPLTPQTLGQLYRDHAPALLLYARQWCSSGEDVVQEAFVKLARQVPPPIRVLPWLYRVVRNEALLAARTDRRRRRREERASVGEVWFAPIADRLDALVATRLLRELALELREVIVAKVWGGLTFEEIASLASCSLATAQRRYQAGLAELKERLEGRWIPTTSPSTIT